MINLSHLCLGCGVQDSKNMNLSRRGTTFYRIYTLLPKGLAYAKSCISVGHSEYKNLTIRKFRIVDCDSR